MSTHTEQLRRRTTASSKSNTSSESTMNNNNNNTNTRSFEHGAGLSAPSMMKSSPSQSGTALKLHVPLLYAILPAFLQRCIMAWSLTKLQFLHWNIRQVLIHLYARSLKSYSY